MGIILKKIKGKAQSLINSMLKDKNNKNKQHLTKKKTM